MNISILVLVASLFPLVTCDILSDLVNKITGTETDTSSASDPDTDHAPDSQPCSDCLSAIPFMTNILETMNSDQIAPIVCSLIGGIPGCPFLVQMLVQALDRYLRQTTPRELCQELTICQK